MSEPRVLRSYQTDAVAAVHDAHRSGTLRPAVVMPTGTGKSSVIGKLAVDHYRDTGRRTVLLAHRGELIDQLVENVAAVSGTTTLTGVVQADRNEVHAPIISATVQTLSRPHRLGQVDNVGLVIVDEAHRAVADTYLQVLGGLGCFTTTPAVGFTATLSRGDDKVLGSVWNEVVFQRTTRWAIDEGYLVPPVGKSVVLDGMDLSSVSRSGGDFQDGALGDVIGAHSESIVTAWRTHGQGRATLAFTPSVSSAEELDAAFRAAGVRSAVVVGETPRAAREEIYDRFRRRDLDVIVSVAVLTEGFDMPHTECVLMARPTSLAHIYVQAVGRGLRPSPGKTDCLVLDVVGVSRRFPLTTISDLGTDARTAYVRADSEDEVDESELVEGGVLPPPRLRHVEELEDVDLFRLSETVWLHTNGGVRFVPAGEEVVFLWPMGDETYLPGRTRSKRPFTAATPMSDHPLDLDTAAALAEAYALEADPTLARRTATWRSRRQPPTPAQVKFAERMGVPNPEMFTKAALSDAITTSMASAVIDR